MALLSYLFEELLTKIWLIPPYFDQIYLKQIWSKFSCFVALEAVIHAP